MRKTCFWTYIHLYVSLAAVALVVTANPTYGQDKSSQAHYEGRWFAADSPWNRPIGDAPELPVSKAAIQAFLATGKTINMNRDIWTPAVIEADSRIDETTDIVFRDSFDFEWTAAAVPVNQDLLNYLDYLDTTNDTDRKVCIYDAAQKGFYSFWKIRRDTRGNITATTGGFSPIDGPGWSQILIKPRISDDSTPTLGAAAGANYCGGLVRFKEMQAGRIEHALAIQWPNDLVLSRKAEKPVLQFPATGTDGRSTDKAVAIPAGARLQLSPALSDEELRGMGLNDADMVIARALQVYGGYVMDTTFGPGVISFENAFNKGKHAYGVTAPLPRALYPYLRFVGPPPVVLLDTASGAGTPVVAP